MLAGMFVIHNGEPHQVHKIADDWISMANGMPERCSLHYLVPTFGGGNMVFVRQFTADQGARAGITCTRLDLLPACKVGHCDAPAGHGCDHIATRRLPNTTPVAA